MMVYTKAGVCWNLAVKVALTGVFPTFPKTNVFVSLFNPITMAADSVAEKASTLSPKSTLQLLGLVAANTSFETAICLRGNCFVL